MRIIDKNTDYYDYLQNVYRDNSITFDRTDSFVLTKDIMCEHLSRGLLKQIQFALLQICNNFWLFLIEVTDFDVIGGYEKPINYTIELLASWKNYDKPRTLIDLKPISFDYDVSYLMRNYNYKERYWVYDKSKIYERIPTLIQAIDTGNYNAGWSVKHTVITGNSKTVKHIPLLKASGIAGCVDPLDIYLSFEEYFSLEKSSSERTASKGITDKEKIENHGFDTKISFRGKTHGG